MEVNKITKYAVGLLIGVILSAGLVIPMVDNVSSETITYHNEGAFYLTSATPYTMEISEGVYTINGKVYSLNLNEEYSLITSDKFALRNYSANANRPILFADISGVNTVNYTIKVEIDNNLHAIVTRDVEGVETVNEFDLEYFYGITPEKTNMVMTKGTVPIYVNEDTPIYCTGRTTVNSWSDIFELEGTINEMSVTALRSAATISNVVVNYEAIEGKTGYTLDNITFDANTTNCTYNKVILPESVTMTKTDLTLDQGQRALIGVIPLLMIIGLVVYAATVVHGRRV